MKKYLPLFLLLVGIVFCTTTQVRASNFSISKSIEGGIPSIESGKIFTYKININYTAPLNPNELVITDLLPQGLIPVGAVIVPNSTAWGQSVVSTSSGYLVTITNLTAINVNGTAEFKIKVKTGYGDIGDDCQFCNEADLTFPNGTLTSNLACINIEARNKWTINKYFDSYMGANVVRYKVYVKPNDVYGNFDLVNFTFYDESAPGSTISYAYGLNLTATNISNNQIVLTRATPLPVPNFSSYIYIFYVDVTYPCPAFATGDNVCNKIKLSADGPDKCPTSTDVVTPTPNWDDFDFDESREKIELAYKSVCHDLIIPTSSGNLTKSHLDKNHVVGCENIYTIQYRNNSTLPIDQIVITDDLPGEIDILGIYYEYLPNTLTIANSDREFLDGSWSPVTTPINNFLIDDSNNTSATKLRWTFGGNLLPNGFISLKVKYKIRATDRISGSIVNVGDVVTNTAHVSANGVAVYNAPGCTIIPNTALNASVSLNFTVENPEGRACLRKSVSNASPNIGDVITYRMAIYNYGGGTLSGTVTDNVPFGLNIVGNSFQYHSSVSNLSINPNFCSSTNTNGQLTNTLPAEIPSPPVITNFQDISFNIVIPPSCQVNQVNKVIVSFDAVVTNLVPPAQDIHNNFQLNNQSSNDATIIVNSVSEFRVEKKVKGDQDLVFGALGNSVSGGNATFEITITNVGNQPIDNIIIYDKLPMTGGDTDAACLGTGSPRNSQFNVAFSGPASSATAHTAYYSNVAPTANINAFTGTATTPAASDNGVKFEFGSYQLTGGNSIVITYSVNVPATATVNQLACNNVTFTAENAYTHDKIGCQISNTACIQINEYIVPCCKETAMDVIGNNSNVSTVVSGDYTIAGVFPTLVAGTIPIQQVRVSLVDFKYKGFSEKACQRCHIEEDEIGIFIKTSLPSIGSLTPLPTIYDREIIWENGVTSLLGGVTVPLRIQLPRTLPIDCCDGEVEVCLKFTMTDVNCETCTFVECYTIPIQ